MEQLNQQVQQRDAREFTDNFLARIGGVKAAQNSPSAVQVEQSTPAQQKVAELVSEYGESAVLPILVKREDFALLMGWRHPRFCMNIAPKDAAKAISAICEENGWMTNHISPFHVTIIDTVENFRFQALIYLMEDNGDWRVLVELQEITGMAYLLTRAFNTLHDQLMKYGFICSDSYSWIIEHGLMDPKMKFEAANQ